MTSGTAIQTRYAGCHFRSRLEARWAVFFDELGIAWRYEPEGHHLPSGHYLPDFALPTIDRGVWFEVKGAHPTPAENTLAAELANATDRPVFIAYGDLPRDVDYAGYDRHNPHRDIDVFHPGGSWDCQQAFCVCPSCRRFGLQFEGRGARVCRHDFHDKGFTGADEQICVAYRVARSARFEHGQSGAE